MANNPKYPTQEPNVGRFSSRIVELGNTSQSQALANEGIVAQNNAAFLAQQRQQQEAARLKAANDAKIDGALEAAAKVNLESAGALRPGMFFPPSSAKGTMGPQLTAEYQLVNQEKNRSKQIITQSFAEKDPISEELNRKIGQVEDELDSVVSSKQSGSPITTGEGGAGAGLFLQDFIKEQALGKDVSVEKEKELRATLANLSQAQVSINRFKTDIQLAKATEDYLLNIKGKGQKIDQNTIKGLVDISKDIVAKQRAATRGDDLYNPDTYETYMTQIKGNNDFFDWRHTDISIGSTLEAVNNKIKEDPSKANELIPVLNELQNAYKQHEKTNKNAYDNYYGAQKRYLKEGMSGSTYLKSQVVGSIGEGFYNFASPFVTTSLDLLGLRKTAFEARQAKDKTYSGAVLYADLNKDQQLDERDWDIHKNYQRVGQDVTYIKQDGSRGYLAESVLGASVRTLAEMVPTLIATRGLMKAGMGARAATFLPVAVSSGVRSFEENKKWYKDKTNAAVVGTIQGIIEGATESIVPDINYFLGNKKLATKALGAGEKKYFIAQTLVPEFTTLSTAAKNFLTSSAYAGKAIASQSLQEGFEEEISMFANYFLDKVYKTKDDQFGEKPQELDDSSILGFGSSMITTFINSAASGLLMSGASIAASRNQDRNYMRFNIANNPELFKQELTKQLQNNQITQDQYNRGILETGRLTQLKERANSTMMNLVDAGTLLEDKDQQYDYFSRLLTRDDLLQKVDYTAMSDEDKVEYAKQVEKVEKEIDSYENLAKQYAEMPQEKKEEVLAKMVQRQLDTVQSTNSPALLAKNLEDVDDAIQVGEKTGKGSPIMVSGRQQIREAVIARMEQLNDVQDNGNTAFENQLLDTPVESMGESMQVSNVVRLEKLLLENSQRISPQVRQELLGRIATASVTAQEQLKSLPKKEQKKVIARELARVELLHPGTAFSDERLQKLFAIQFTPEEKSELIRETAVTISREKEKIQEEDVFQPTEKDTVMDVLIKSFESQPLEVQVENEQGNLERVRNEERKTREMRAIFAIPRSKSKDQAKSRVKSIFKAMGYSAEDINKALEDLNQVFDNQEVTNPGELYTSYLRFLNPTLLKGLPDKVIPQEDILAEEPVVETATEVTTPSEIPDQEYSNFIDNGIVSIERIQSIANKVKNNEQLSPREKEIFTDKTAEINAELVVLAKTSSTLEEDELFGTNEEIDAAREKKLEIPEVDPADQVVEVTVEAPVIEDEFDGLEVVPVSKIESSDLVATTPTFSTSSNSGVQGSIMKTISNSIESFNLKLVDMFSFIRETLGESSMSTLERIYNNVTEELKTNNLEAITRLKEEYLAVFSGSTFANEQLEYIWKEQYIKGKPDASIPFQDLAYVTNGQFAIAYQGDEVIVTGVNKQTEEIFTYNATVTGKVNESNQIEVKTRNGKIVYIKKSNLQTIAFRPINVRTNFNQTNSIMMTAVDRTTGEIAKFNSNGERDAQGDTQLNVFVPRENDTMKEVRKSLASGQPIAHTLSIHAGARINNAFAYREGKNSVYLTASVAGIDTSIQTSEPEVEVSIEVIEELQPEVTTNLSKDELDILSFDVSSIEGLEGATESLDQNTSKEIDDAGSCRIN